MEYHELETKIFNFFIEDKSLLKIIGFNDEVHYNYLLKQIQKKVQTTNNIRLYYQGFPMPSDIRAIQVVQGSVEGMNLNQLNQENISLVSNPAINKKVKDAILTILQPRLLQPFKSQNIKMNFFTKQIVWLYEFLNKNYKESENKILIYYGTVTEDDLYQLQMLYMLGFRILYINSFQDVNIGVGETIQLENIAPMKSFIERINQAVSILPEESITNKENTENKITTWAGEAKEELYNNLYDENSIIRPWQFKKYTTLSINFNAVLEDIQTYWKEDAKLRPEFKVQDNKVIIPNFMTKINGCYSDLGKYYELIEDLRNTDLNLFLNSTTFLSTNYLSEEMYSLGFIFRSQDKFIDIEKLKKHELYRLKNINQDVQNFIIKKLNEFIEKNPEIELKYIVELIATVITMDEKFLQLIENFDYPFKVPKIIFYLYNRDTFDMRTGNFIQYLNLIGFDILFFSPIGSESIEEYMYHGTLNTIYLEEMKFDLTYEELEKHKKRTTTKKKNFFSNLFGGE